MRPSVLCLELRPWMRREFGWPLVELGNIRLRKGDLVGAEEAFLAAHEHAWSPHPGLALLRLAQGDVETASMMIADAIAHPLDIPSKERPPVGDLRLAPLLDAQAESRPLPMTRARFAMRPRRCRRSLTRIPAARSLRLLRWRALDSHSSRGRRERAIDGATAAIAAWADIGAPFEAAVARIVLADARDVGR